MVSFIKMVKVTHLCVVLVGLLFMQSHEATNTSSTISLDPAQMEASSLTNYAKNFGEFSHILVEKYSSSNSVLNSSDFKSMWSVVFMPNATHHPSPTPASVKDPPPFCEKNRDGTMPQLCKAVTQCIGAKEIFEMATQNGKIPLTKDSLQNLCPLMLYQMESGLCRGIEFDSDGRPEIKLADVKKKPSPSEVWGYGVLFVTLISLCSLVGVSVLPLMGKAFYAKLLTVLVGLAVGSLSGSSVFHLIPQAFGLPDSDPEHGYLQTSLLLWVGIWLFFLIERLLKIIMDTKQRRSDMVKAANATVLPLVDQSFNKSINCKASSYRHSHSSGDPSVAKIPDPSTEPTYLGPEIEKIYESQEQVIKASFGHQAKPQRSHSHEHIIHYKGGDSPIATVAWMIIFGDGFHNFIDGLSLGAAFNESITTGISISVAVMCEELPHELGDFAVLLSSGMTMRQALLYNFLSACTCYLGLALGILLGEIEASMYIFAIAGGMFLYIALVDMVPEMNEIAEQASKTSLAQAFKVLTLQNLGVIFGVGALYILARFQDQIRFG